MTTSAQQIPSNPALDFANSILEVTNNGLELIEILRDIANDCDEKATTNDRIAAANILTDRAFGKCPKQVSPSPDPTPEADDNGVEALREAPSAKPESPRLVTQIDDALHDSLGPPPSAHTPPRHSRANGNPESYDVSDSPEYETPDPSDPYSSTTPSNSTFSPSPTTARCSATSFWKSPGRKTTRRTVLSRAEGSHPTTGAGPHPSFWTDSWAQTPTLSAAESAPTAAKSGRPTQVHTITLTQASVEKVEDLPSDDEVWAKIEADLKRMEDEGILTPDPNGSPIDISNYRFPKDFDSTPYEEEEAAAFKAEIELRLERQKQWPEIEERRRKKLAQIYPSHSDGEQPDT